MTMEVNPLAALKVGDEVIIRDVNERLLGGRQTGKVVKVGRKLLHVESAWRVLTYEIDGGYRNDAYRHSWITTKEVQDTVDRRQDIIRALRQCHVEIDPAWQKDYSTDQLERILAVVVETNG